MATKLSKKDSQSLMESGFFNNWTITHSFNKEEIYSKLNNPKTEGIKVKVKFYDSLHLKNECIGFVIDVTDQGELRIVEDGPNAPTIHVIDPKWIIGIFFITLGREIEINFGVGRSYVSSLVDEQ